MLQTKKIEDLVQGYIEFVLIQENGNVNHVSKLLGITRATIYRRVTKEFLDKARTTKPKVSKNLPEGF